MRTRFLGVLFCFIGLNGLACLRSLDGSKVPCTTSDHCPSHYTCHSGTCTSREASDSGNTADARPTSDGPRSETADSGRPAGPDATAPATSPDAPLTGGDAAAGGTTGTTDSTSNPSTSTAGGTAGAAGSTSNPSASTDGGTAGVAGSTGTAGATGTGGSTTGGSAKLTSSLSSVAGASGLGGTITPASSAAGGATLTSSSTPGTAGAAGSSSKGGSSVALSSSGGAGTGGGTTTGGSAGASANSSATCQPKPRDCTSTQDNNCNGTPDNQETAYCTCPVNQKRDCQEHPGYDGHGICKKGSQTCTTGSDKTTSSWSDCSGAVGPGVEVCDAADADENCNDQSNEGCECVNETQVACDCGPPTTCTNGKKGTCSVTKVTKYRDFDNDGHGETQATQVCPGVTGYVDSHDDCDDRDPNFYPGKDICLTTAQIKRCESGGVTNRTTCDYGCAGDKCHPSTDGTIGVPGYVSCTASSAACPVIEGCITYDGSCGGTNPNFYCDGPNDCPGQECWLINPPRWIGTSCSNTRPEEASAALVCDPLASLCPPPLTCSKFLDSYPIYTCQ